MRQPLKTKVRHLTDSEFEDLIIQARVKLVLKHPFFGSLISRMDMVDGSGWVPTAATDGKYLYYNRDFFASMSVLEVAWVLGHEILHCVYGHMWRREKRDPFLYNCAGDYIINYDLYEQRVGVQPKHIEILFDEQYANMTSEEVYDLLKKKHDRSPKINVKVNVRSSGQGSGGGQGNSGDSEDGQDQQTQNSQGEIDSEFKRQLAEGQFDVHLDENKDDVEQDGGGKAKEDETGYNGPIPMSDDQRRQLENEIKEAVIQAAKAAEGAGNVPSGVKRLIDDMSESVMDWRSLLTVTIQSILKSDFTFMRQNRKSQQLGVYLPGMLHDDVVSVFIAIDTSGSITHNMIRDFLGEVKGIMEQYEDFKIQLVFFDTMTYTLHEFTPDNMYELLDVEPEGGGGTEYTCVWERLKEEDIQPEQLVMFTDGYPFGSWGDPDYCETLFVITENRTVEAPFGVTTYYEDHVR